MFLDPVVLREKGIQTKVQKLHGKTVMATSLITVTVLFAVHVNACMKWTVYKSTTTTTTTAFGKVSCGGIGLY